MVSISLAIGTAHSLPPIRLKRFQGGGAFCGGAIVNLGLLPVQFVKKKPVYSTTVWALTLFVLVFTFGIAIFKDIP